MCATAEQLHEDHDATRCGSGAGEADLPTALLLHVCRRPQQPPPAQGHVQLVQGHANQVG